MKISCTSTTQQEGGRTLELVNYYHSDMKKQNNLKRKGRARDVDPQWETGKGRPVPCSKAIMNKYIITQLWFIHPERVGQVLGDSNCFALPNSTFSSIIGRHLLQMRAKPYEAQRKWNHNKKNFLLGENYHNLWSYTTCFRCYNNF